MLRRHGFGDGRRARRPRPISFSLSFRSFFSPPPLAPFFHSFSLAVLDRSNGIIISWRVWFPSVSDSLVAPLRQRALARARPPRRLRPAPPSPPSYIVRRDRRLHYWFPKMAAAVAALQCQRSNYRRSRRRQHLMSVRIAMSRRTAPLMDLRWPLFHFHPL